MARRERTRRLLELGGVVQKAGLVALTDDARAAPLGGMLALSCEGGSQQLELRCRSGRRAFEAEQNRREPADA